MVWIGVGVGVGVDSLRFGENVDCPSGKDVVTWIGLERHGQW